MGKKLAETIKENIEIATPKTAKSEANEVNLDSIAKALTASKDGIKGIKVNCINELVELPVPRFISSGDFIFDMCSGGGVPLARGIEIIGKESCGKSSLAMSILNTMLIKENGYALLFDKEKAWDFPTRNIELGLPKELSKHVVTVDAPSFEALFETIEKYLKLMVITNKVRNAPIYIIIDSVAAICSEKENESDYGDMGYQTHAKVIAQAHRKLWTCMIDNDMNNVAIIYVNQAKTAFAKPGEFLPPSELATFGGAAVKFYSSIRVELTRIRQLAKKKGDKNYVVGIQSKARFIKNKVFYPLQAHTMRFMGRNGNDAVMNVYDWAVETKAIVKSSAGEIKAGKAPFKIKLSNGESLFFDSVKSFRDLYEKSASSIEETLRKSYLQTLSDVSDLVAGNSDDCILLDESPADESKESTGEIEL